MTFKKGQSGNPSGGLRTRKPWREALERAVKRRGGVKVGGPQYLEVIADQCVRDAADGSIAAIREIADRLDGKAVQGVELDLAVTVTAIERTIVDPQLVAPVINAIAAEDDTPSDI